MAEGSQIGQVSQPVPQQFADAEIPQLLASRACPICSAPKTPGDAFCKTDLAALPLWLRNWMQRTSEAAFPTWFRAACAHLRALPTRRQVYLRNGQVWRYSSDAELAAAGYSKAEQNMFCRCGAPRCGLRVVWYWTPNGRKIPLDFETLRPHFDLCRNPEYFAVRRSMRTSAGRRRA